MAKNERDMLNRHNVFIIFAFAALNSRVNYAQGMCVTDDVYFRAFRICLFIYLLYIFRLSFYLSVLFIILDIWLYI